jgi:hypothetical protein
MHLAYARVLVRELGEENGKDAIIKAMMEYGKLVGQRKKAGKQDLPWYGFHDKYVYQEEEFVDTRDQPSKDFDFSLYKVFGCILAKTFVEYGEPELGALYCYVDAAKSMAADPTSKLIHTACEVCGDEFCAFDYIPATEEERTDFEEQNPKWKKVDIILLMDEKDEKS